MRPVVRYSPLLILPAVILLACLRDLRSFPYLLPDALLSQAPRDDTDALRSSEWLDTPDVDIVFAQYSESLSLLTETLNFIRQSLPKALTSRVIVYVKGNTPPSDFLPVAAEVITLKNVGREGETFLQHIVRHHKNGVRELAPHTIFLQPELHLHDLVQRRLGVLSPATGFLSLADYAVLKRGIDQEGLRWPNLIDIYMVFRKTFFPTYDLLNTFRGQFVVSRTRILENSLEQYHKLLDMFQVDESHWIWNSEPVGTISTNTPSSPILGHALERSWTLIFNCTDAGILYRCPTGLQEPERIAANCQCLDD